MGDSLGDRMKDQYEDRTRYSLPRRTYTIIRLDGKAFHNFTKNFERPFDTHFIYLMDHTAKVLCTQIQGAKFAYVQSDEISILLTDFEGEKTNAWFDGNIQKITSISASMATAAFNKALIESTHIVPKLALFDSRVFTIPDPIEVENYFIWRQQDATRNSVQMVAQSLYSHKELQGRNNSELQEMIFQKGQNWNNIPDGQKRGRAVIRSNVYRGPIGEDAEDCFLKSSWTLVDPPVFTQNRNFLRRLIPTINRPNAAEFDTAEEYFAAVAKEEDIDE